MKNLTKMMVAVIVTICLITLSACGKASTTNENTWQKVEKSKTITIGFDNTFVPMGFKDKDGTNKGFDIDLANAVFKTYGIKVKWQPITWSLKEQELKNGNIDLIWNGYSVTPEREKLVKFSEPYMEGGDILLTKKSSDITKISEMKGKTIGAQSGSSQYQVFNDQPTKLKDLVAGKTIVQYSTFEQGLLDVKNGRIDALLVDQVYANYYLKQSNETNLFNSIPVDFESSPMAVGARKADSVLIEKINAGINKLVANGEFKTISERWFGKDVYPVTK
ncbi:amino acid ABC transporter substrate-binding protein [Lactococcus fujiensis]|uniref:ABC transporter glutamine binding protein n=1 Tax=Lactococcus fujiensis JCM 16395 TaxID=1291764 RepID=A0A2A5RN28_9LACT|nr:amino acid ABC transporter substrate-binding protein [Lactococcus fujiensis]PCS00713.1 ABC transporter glutamine binding protein [Lactococcus fujiensis JCM 16395]